MNNPPFSQEVYFYGKKEPLSLKRSLTAGPFQLVYESGSIRYIKLNNIEVLRMIYSAVRDHNWDTIEPKILDEKIIVLDSSFSIEFEAEYKKDDIHFVANYNIIGSENGDIRCVMNGKALSSFKKNRIGFCTLHPINECTGKACEVTHSYGEISHGYFPEFVSPDQPFKNIKIFRWRIVDGVFATLEFHGEIFEMEDQRNWTDASYKIYCTPLERPFPVQLHKGDEINQIVELKLEGFQINELLKKQEDEECPVFSILPGKEKILPKIGTCRSSENNQLSARDISLIRDAKFNHLRVDVKLFDLNWKNDFITVCKEAVQLGLQLEIALHFPNNKNLRNVINQFIVATYQTEITIYSLILFEKGSKVTPDNLIKEIVPHLRENFKTSRIGIGTDAYFAELNRNITATMGIDFITFSINPQVHSFDNSSLVETLEAQGSTVVSAQEIYPDKAIHISPVTLKPRFNPNSTLPEKASPKEPLPFQVDVRQRSLLGAGWTIGSIKYLSEAGAKSITIYEKVGRKGFFISENGIEVKEGFPANKGEVFPVFIVIKDIQEFSGSELIMSKSSDPLKFDGLVLKKNDRMRIILSNYLNNMINIRIPSLEGKIKIREIDANVISDKNWHESLSYSSFSSNQGEKFSMTLKPYGLLTIDVTPE